MKKKILMMVLAMTMLAGCGAKEATPTDVGVADTTVAEEVVVDEQDNQEVVQEEVASDTEQVTEEPAVEEPEKGLPAVLTSDTFRDSYLYDISYYATDENGNKLQDVSLITEEFYQMYYTKIDKVPFDKSFEYVDVDGEKWIQATWHIPAGSRGVLHQLCETDTDFVLSYSPDFFKVMYDGVVYSASQEYIDSAKQYSPLSRDYDKHGDFFNPYYDENGNVIQ